MTRPFTRGGLRSPFLDDLKRPFFQENRKRMETGYKRGGSPAGIKEDRPSKGI